MSYRTRGDPRACRCTKSTASRACGLLPRLHERVQAQKLCGRAATLDRGGFLEQRKRTDVTKPGLHDLLGLHGLAQRCETDRKVEIPGPRCTRTDGRDPAAQQQNAEPNSATGAAGIQHPTRDLLGAHWSWTAGDLWEYTQQNPTPEAGPRTAGNEAGTDAGRTRRARDLEGDRGTWET